MARKSRKVRSYDDLPPQIWKTAIYARLSREREESESIETQIDEVKEYVLQRPMFYLVDIYADDGFSGSNFNRPAFERLMEDIRSRQIDCIVVKDLSRFAREHIGAEDYLNNIFPFLGIRFIAIRDNYDNIDIKPQEYFLASFKNFANSYFAKETSRKVSQAKRILQEQGKYIGARPPYGYKKDPVDKHKLVIDNEKAEIVREVFRRSADGELHGSICDDLNKRGIKAAKSAWTVNVIYYMLTKEAYIGTLVQHTTERAVYKYEGMKKIPKSEHLRFENAFPAIIEREIWDKVQARIKSRNPRNKGGART
jgi:DNA invertase Pin-like site-specific DNA recombinase